ncbi:MAG: hypothetical protein KDD39_11870, partial [Bdellovibrionales bacterium]|nr:hypothetical protein [Bdellovibrionales bacterium]
LVSIGAFLCTFVLATEAKVGEVKPDLVKTALNQAFIPTGFDSNDHVQIVVAGEFVNTCYQVGPYRATIDEKAKQIVISQTAYHYQGTCLDVTVPFNHEVELGIMEPGEYQVVDASSKWKLGTLSVVEATRPEVDDVPYAPVEDAFVVKDGTTGNPALVFWGTLTKDCYEVTDKTVEPKLYDDVLVIRPLLKKTKEDCNNGFFPFRVTYVLPEKLPRQFLLHVRSMNGQAINKVITPAINR